MDRIAAAGRLKTFEGLTDYLYRCTGGVVTVGVGHAIPDAASALLLPWDAPAAQVETDFARVAAAAQGLPAARYQGLTRCRLSARSIDALLLADMEQFSAALTARFPAWNGYPEPAQQALFDMAYNLGVGGLLKFQRLLAACASGDWETAATQCHRGGIGDARNQETCALFRQAARG
jgi:GH24 family phage-related lysozyme (muramidase)